METARRSAAVGIAVAVMSLAVACERSGSSPDTTRPDSEGARLVAHYQCNRCHVAEELLEAAPHETNCAGCHQAIMGGEYDWKPWRYSRAQVDHWKTNLTHLLAVPTLTGAERFERDWLVEFLQDPHSLRPRLGATMPRFAMSAEDAAAIADYLIGAGRRFEAVDLSDADLEAGRDVLGENACGFCHRFTGADPLDPSAQLFDMEPDELADALALAPDLRHTRRRMSAEAVMAWLGDPKQLKADAAMPRIELTDDERRDATAYIMQTPLQEASPVDIPERLPVLEREVSYAEVEARVFKKVCWHCHSDPDGNFGDGGPGNTGGLGFAGAGLDLGSLEAIRRGSLGDDGQRRSVLEPLDDGTPRLVAHMLARHSEHAGEPVDDVLGMPLGLPPMSMEEIQLVETWIAQERQRSRQQRLRE